MRQLIEAEDGKERIKKLKKSSSMTMVKSVVALLLVTLIGAYIFQALESDQELKDKKVYTEFYAALKEKLPNTTFDKLGLDAPANSHNNWSSLGSAFVFTFTILTSIGYGAFAPTTQAGMVFLIFFGLVSIPLAGITFAMMAQRVSEGATYLVSFQTDKIAAAFKVYDEDGSGQISTGEIKDALKDLGIRMTQQELKELLDFVDDDGSGELDLEEFRGAVDHLGADVSEAALRKTRALVAISLFSFLTCVGMLVFGSIEFSGQDLPYLDGIYFCIVTLTSIGFGDLTPSTAAGDIFLIFFVSFGMGLLALFIGIASDFVIAYRKKVQKRLEEAAKDATTRVERRMSNKDGEEPV
jgi:hypothetical protein